jgi:hypothetical protein
MNLASLSHQKGRKNEKVENLRKKAAVVAVPPARASHGRESLTRA